MLDHVSITVSDIAAAERFYDAIMKALDVVKVGRRDDWLGYGERARRPIRTGSISPSARDQNRTTPSAAIGVSRRSGGPRSDAFWDAGIAAGGIDDGPPGLRDYHASYYGAFLRDPDGNRVEAVCHHAV
jgi:catechol 2,3-dioxygenase-like lactoylglutathione lyase family enzyme